LHAAQFDIAPDRNPVVTVQFSHHAILRANERGTTLEEIEAVLASGEVHHAVEGDVIVVVTVYVFFGGRES
jgi:hypothetical protein